MAGMLPWHKLDKLLIWNSPFLGPTIVFFGIALDEITFYLALAYQWSKNGTLSLSPKKTAAHILQDGQLKTRSRKLSNHLISLWVARAVRFDAFC